MTGREVINRAIDLLGYSPANGNTQIAPRIMNRAVSIVNVVYEDLWGITSAQEFEPIKALPDEVKLTGRALECMPYGVAAFIAQSESDGDGQQLWMLTYNKKRRTLSKSYIRQDVLPIERG